MDEQQEKKLADKLRRAAAVREREIDEAIVAFMQHSQGRRAVYWLLELAGTNSNPFVGNALSTAFNCGRQSIGQALQSRVATVAPDFYLTMLKESENEQRTLRNAENTDDNAESES